MKSHFVMMAEYNAWANARLYEMARRLPDEQYRQDVGAYFKSLHGTLNHIMAADLIWMRRLTGTGDHPSKLSAIVFDDLVSLSAARQREDQRIIDFVGTLSDDQIEEQLEYSMLNGKSGKQRRREVLAHVFNHQTHHRGQAHAVLTLLGIAEPDPLDLLIMQRERSEA
ncbi:MAG: DinB family protein [Povalibacter sp.]